MKKGSVVLIILLAVAFLGLGLGGYFLFKGEKKLDSKVTTRPETQDVKQEGLSTFVQSKLGYSFQYPSDWGVLEMSHSLLVAPKQVVEKYRQKNELGNYGGGPDMTIQVFIEDGSNNTEIYESSSRKITKKQMNVSGQAVDEYNFLWTEEGPWGDAGKKTMSWVINFPTEKVRIDLLDLSYEKEARQVVDSFKFFVVENADLKELKGKTTVEVGMKLGAPNFKKENLTTKREIWVYTAAGDSTASYYYFESGKLIDAKTDEFNGELGSDPFLK